VFFYWCIETIQLKKFVAFVQFWFFLWKSPAMSISKFTQMCYDCLYPWARYLTRLAHPVAFVVVVFMTGWLRIKLTSVVRTPLTSVRQGQFKFIVIFGSRFKSLELFPVIHPCILRRINMNGYRKLLLT